MHPILFLASTMELLLLFTAFAASAFAQTISIATPAAGSTIPAGSQIVVEVDRAVSRSHWSTHNAAAYLINRRQIVRRRRWF